MASLDARPTGAGLYREIRGYCVSVSCTIEEFSRASGIANTTISSIREAFYPSPRTVERVRGFITDNPGGIAARTLPARGPKTTSRDGARAVARARELSVAPARPDPAAVAAAARECAFRPSARSMGEKAPAYLNRLRRDLTPAEQISTLCVATPGDTVGLVKQRWPDVWNRVVNAARDVGQAPGAMLVALIERGLDADAVAG
jgi:hypothetical protein